jgi:hypothetical protein
MASAMLMGLFELESPSVDNLLDSDDIKYMLDSLDQI